jgi:hypothetical protein
MPLIDETPGAQEFLCDGCGYAGLAFPNQCTSDYGMDATGRTFCRTCCAERDRESMNRGEPITSYVMCDGKTIGTWHGFPLARVESITLVRRYSWNSVYSIHARDDRGRLWVGRGGGPGMYCNLRLSRAR